MTYRYFTVSNFISASRIILVIPMGYCLLSEFPHHRLWTVGVILVAVITDFLDGFLARKLHQVTEIGKIIDPLADKIGIGVYAVLLAMTGDVPLWFVVFVLLRDLLIFSGGLYIHQSKNFSEQCCCYFFLSNTADGCVEPPLDFFSLGKCCLNGVVIVELYSKTLYWQKH
jgi:CDP-diacylglycerol--glycerol-3-phosphate 3-phosphatidyltransferase